MKKMLSLLAAAAAAVCIALPAHAQAQHKVYDSAQVLSEEDERALEKLAEQLVLDHGVDAVICTERSITSSPEERAKSLYNSLDAGAGDNRDGILLLIWFENDEQHFVTLKNGWAQEVFTGYADERIEELTAKDVEARDFTGAAQQWLRLSDKFMSAHEKGRPYDGARVYRTGGECLRVFLLWLAGGALAAAAVCALMRLTMRTKPLIRHSEEISPDKSTFALTKQRDILLYSQTESVGAAENTGDKEKLADKE